MARRLGKRQLERAQRTFEDAVIAELTAHGAVFDGSFHHILPTRAGLLLARGIPSVLDAGGFVALRFDDVGAAQSFLSSPHPSSSRFRGELNPYSGKWNLNLFGREFGEGCEDRIRAVLRLKLAAVIFAEELSPDEWKRRLEAGIRARAERLAKMFGTEGSVER